MLDINIETADKHANVGNDENNNRKEGILGIFADKSKDSVYSWCVAIAGCLLQILNLGILHVFGMYFVEFIKEFNTTKGTTAWIGSLAYGLSMLFGPVTSFVINRYGAHVSIAMGETLVFLSLLVSSFMPRLEYLFFTFSVCFGLGTSLTYIPTMCMAGDYFDKYLTVATGLTVSGSSLGTLIMSPITQASIRVMGWRNTMRLHAALTTVIYLCAYMFRHSTVTEAKQCNRRLPLARRIVKDLQLWKNRVFVIWVMAMCCALFGYYIPYVHLITHAESLGISSRHSGIVIMLMGGATAFGRILFGKIVEYGFLNHLHMHQLALVATGTGYMLLPLIKDFAGLVVFVILMGLVDGCLVVLMPLLTSNLVGSDRKVLAWGYLSCLCSVTYTLGPPSAGWLCDKYGSYNLAFHVAGVPVVFAALLMFFIPWAQRTGKSVNSLCNVALSYSVMEDIMEYEPSEVYTIENHNFTMSKPKRVPSSEFCNSLANSVGSCPLTPGKLVTDGHMTSSTPKCSIDYSQQAASPSCSFCASLRDTSDITSHCLSLKDTSDVITIKADSSFMVVDLNKNNLVAANIVDKDAFQSRVVEALNILTQGMALPQQRPVPGRRRRTVSVDDAAMSEHQPWTLHENDNKVSPTKEMPEPIGIERKQADSIYFEDTSSASSESFEHIDYNQVFSCSNYQIPDTWSSAASHLGNNIETTVQSPTPSNTKSLMSSKQPLRSSHQNSQPPSHHALLHIPTRRRCISLNEPSSTSVTSPSNISSPTVPEKR